jgi:hypothetical protein
MSAPDSSRGAKTSPKAARSQMFEVRDEKPAPTPPQLLRRKIDPFEDPPEIHRRSTRSSTVTTTRQPRPLDLISTERERIEPRHPAPLIDSALDLRQARLIRQRSFDARPAYHMPAPNRSLFDLIHDHPWLLGLVCAVCIAILVFASPAPQLIISSGGQIGAVSKLSPAAAEPAAETMNTQHGEHSLVGEPTIDAELIDAVLAKYGSPAAGTGRAWVQLGRQYGIDPAYALAFFIHESTAGTNPGWAGLKPGGGSTHNIGNIICAGYPTCFGRFRDYGSWEEGIEDWYKLIKREYIGDRGVHTIEQIIPIYAPSFENNVPAYVGVVVGLVEDWRNGGGR